MAEVKRWTVEIVIDEHGDERLTRAEARLEVPDRSRLAGVGRARRNPVDPEVPKIGDELAVSRALADLSHQLLEVAAADIEQTTQDRVRLRG
ncbi:DUF1876 domain-containing protein [Micromonospora sp. CPCC 206061]|uniref:DUF1876 domain-containing protein n=1 Tax=Micromonospora sp. CPCC 206061 TaxID=3122410 RepID=UPI002FEF5E8B